jgi:Flp pilus assembly protein TadB
MKFEKREILLIAGILFLMIGMMAFLPPIYALVIAVLIYFGIKVFVGRRKRQIQREIGQGICAVCGAKITGGKCPKCDLQ